MLNMSNILNRSEIILIMKKETPKAKKLVRQHANYILHITPEAKELGWTDKTLVKTKVEGKKLIIEKIADL